MSNVRHFRSRAGKAAGLQKGAAGSPTSLPLQLNTCSIEDLAALLLGTAAEMAKRSANPGIVTKADPLAKFAERLLQERRSRTAFIDGALLGEPVWDLLLDLYVSQGAGKRVSVSSACIAAGVPATTALRYIDAMVKAQLVERESSATDRRTSYLVLTSATHHALSDLLLWMAEGRRVPRKAD